MELLNCEQRDKSLGSDNLDFGEADSFENVVMMITRDDIIARGRDGTINEFVVVGIGCDEIEAVSRVDEDNKGRISKKV